MFVVRASGRSAPVDDDRREFSLLGKSQVSGLAPARPVTTGVRSRAVLELQQNYGGLQFRALVGGEFAPGEGDRLAWRVRFWKTVRSTPQQGLLPGLPEGLDHAAAAGLHANLNSGALPAGQLVIDRAGYDQESSPRTVRNGRRAPVAHPAGGRLRIARGAGHQVLGDHRPNSGGPAQS